MTMPLEKKLRGMIQIFRLELPFAAGVCVVLGEVIALQSLPPVREALLGFACAFFISSSALILNDYFDLEVDRINQPDRPLPSGIITPAESVLLTVFTSFVGLAAALAISRLAFVLAVFFWSVGVLYNWKFKQTGLPGNLMVASCVACTFLLGGLAVGQPLNPVVWFFALIAFLIDLAEEIAGDAMDMEGDRKRGSRTIAIIFGRDAALRITGALFLLVVLVSMFPFLLGWVGPFYLIIVLILGINTLVSVAGLIRSGTPEDGRRYMRRIYLGALFGMLAYIGAQILV